LFPNIPISLGDIRALQFKDAYFDGYLSLGVIEHFINGYEQIIDEMHRVLKPRGILLLSVPTISYLRHLKIKLGQYPEIQLKTVNNDYFYQFAFYNKKIIDSIQSKGFTIKTTYKFDGLKGMKETISILKPIVQYIYDSNYLPIKLIRYVLNKVLTPFSNHMTIFVFQKNQANPASTSSVITKPLTSSLTQCNLDQTPEK
jgi:SAM-dependent methyltransferase